jgi:hypothetical protein
MKPVHSKIKTWQKFAKVVRANQEELLSHLDKFKNSVLITGCQRSGGTMLSRVITATDEMENFWFSKDEELDAGLILSGSVDYHSDKRHCFQTTYLNERYREYYKHPGHKILWSLRNPYSVVYSMAYNWDRFALNELFVCCGLPYMNAKDRVSFQRFFVFGLSPVKRAAYAYCGKVSQILELSKNLDAQSLAVLEYDHLVKNKLKVLPRVYDFIDLPYKPSYADPISERSIKKMDKLSTQEKAIISSICDPVYESALATITLE